MTTEKLRVAYIASLLILATLLVLFAQGVFTGLLDEDSTPVIEINRIDLYSDFLGNYSKISVKISNSDTVDHNFTISTVQDEVTTNNYNVTIRSGKTFSYQTDVLPDRVPISSNETINSTLQVTKFIVYMDDRPKPIEEASFVFKG
ncbi:MAG: hypothetical protein JW705_01000 [Methanosarcinaceae archaeon]|nr:hypothetical protein [Methanosarcinaceae archaeon]